MSRAKTPAQYKAERRAAEQDMERDRAWEERMRRQTDPTERESLIDALGEAETWEEARDLIVSALNGGVL